MNFHIREIARGASTSDTRDEEQLYRGEGSTEESKQPDSLI